MLYVDLDNTVIYSEKFLKKNNININNNLILIENTDKVKSYMSKLTYDILKSVYYVPVTTRSPRQFDRIRENLPSHEYAIISNGGRILHNKLGLMSNIPANIEDIKKLQEKFGGKIVDGFFLMFKDLTNDLRYDGYTFYKGRKSYLIPSQTTKYNAIKKLNSYLNIKEFFSIGDSYMDFEMIRHSTNKMLLRHGEILEDEHEYTKGIGFEAIEEVLTRYCNKN